jgi:hypothetical protein
MRVFLFALAVVGTLASCSHASRPSALDVSPNPAVGGSSTADASTTGEAGTTGQALVDNISAPHGLALSSTDVFFSSGTGTAAISSVPTAGGAVAPLVRGLTLPTELLLVNGLLVWIDLGSSAQAGAVFKLDPSTSVAAQISGPLQSPTAIASDGRYVYIASAFPSGGVSIDRVPLASGPPFSVTTVVGDFTPAGMVIDARYAYFVGKTLAGGAVYRVALTGGPAEALWSTNGGTLGAVAVTGAHLYWTLDAPNAGAATIFSVPITGGMAVALAAQQPHAERLAFDNVSLFWTTGTDGQVVRVPLSGGASDVVASGLGSALHIAVSDAVYVTTATGIVKIPR